MDVFGSRMRCFGANTWETLSAQCEFLRVCNAQINVERGRFRSVFRDLVAKSPYLFNQGGLIRLTRNEALKRIIQGIELCKNIFCIVKTVSALER